ncbi:hypothetical protein SLS61_007111 [Didymella pomorum]
MDPLALQELLAPKSVEFFSKEGFRLGDKVSLQKWIHEITRIPHEALRGDDLTNFTVEERLSWASNRETRRPEDKAYCLLGIVKVFVIPNYGEGGENAWTRLLERINQNRDRTRVEDEAVQKTLSKLPPQREP